MLDGNFFLFCLGFFFGFYVAFRVVKKNGVVFLFSFFYRVNLGIHIFIFVCEQIMKFWGENYTLLW